MKFTYTSRLHSATTVEFDNILYLWDWYQPLHKPIGQDAVRCLFSWSQIPATESTNTLIPARETLQIRT